MIKGNQKELKAQVEKMFRIKRADSTYEQLDSGHGRVESRKCSVIGGLKFFDVKDDWEGVKSVIRIESGRYDKKTGKESFETRFYISSLPPDAKQVSKAVRSHWAIENNLHWNLDVVLKEDGALKKKDNSAIKFNIISKMALTMLENKKSGKRKKPQKRLKAALNDNYREKLLQC